MRRHALRGASAACSVGLALFLLPLSPAPSVATAPPPDPLRTLERSLADDGVVASRTTTAATPRGPAGRTSYVAYDRTYAGLPVHGGDFVVAVGADGRITGATGAPRRDVSVPTTVPSVPASRAASTARARVPGATTVGRPSLEIYADGQPRLAWRTEVSVGRGLLAQVTTVWTDARDGRVLMVDAPVHYGDGEGHYTGDVEIPTSTPDQGQTYRMADPEQRGVMCGGQDGSVFTGPDDVWGDGVGTDLETACVDVLYATNAETDMLRAWFGRDGIDGRGSAYQALVGMNDVNAYFNGRVVNFGRSQDRRRQLTSIDIVAHEQGHGVFATTPGGDVGGRETRALNEGAADILGTLTEFYANNPSDPPDFLIGEQSDFFGRGAVRDMARPGRMGDPGCWTPQLKRLDPHSGGAVFSHWFYLLSRGTVATRTCSTKRFVGVGVRRAGQVFYEGLLLKTSGWTYAKARKATLLAAKNLDPTCTTFLRTRKSWNAVAVRHQPGEVSCTPR